MVVRLWQQYQPRSHVWRDASVTTTKVCGAEEAEDPTTDIRQGGPLHEVDGTEPPRLVLDLLRDDLKGTTQIVIWNPPSTKLKKKPLFFLHSALLPNLILLDDKTLYINSSLYCTKITFTDTRVWELYPFSTFFLFLKFKHVCGSKFLSQRFQIMWHYYGMLILVEGFFFFQILDWF